MVLIANALQTFCGEISFHHPSEKMIFMIVISSMIECMRENLWKREIRTSVEKLHGVIKFGPRVKVLATAVV